MSDSVELANLYRGVILRHAASPCNHGVCIDATHRASGNNPLCGDEVEIFLRIEDGVVVASAFHGESCAICMASASVLCQHLPGRSVADLDMMTAAFEQALAGDDAGALADFLVPLTGVQRYPSRVGCALLPWQTALVAEQLVV